MRCWSRSVPVYTLVVRGISISSASKDTSGLYSASCEIHVCVSGVAIIYAAFPRAIADFTISACMYVLLRRMNSQYRRSAKGELSVPLINIDIPLRRTRSIIQEIVHKDDWSICWCKVLMLSAADPDLGYQLPDEVNGFPERADAWNCYWHRSSIVALAVAVTVSNGHTSAPGATLIDDDRVLVGTLSCTGWRRFLPYLDVCDRLCDSIVADILG